MRYLFNRIAVALERIARALEGIEEALGGKIHLRLGNAYRSDRSDQR